VPAGHGYHGEPLAPFKRELLLRDTPSSTKDVWLWA